MSTVVQRFIATAAIMVLLLGPLPSRAQGVFPSPQALPELQVDVAGAVNAIVPYNDGGTDYYVIAGSFDRVNGQARRNLALLNLDGSLADGGFVTAWTTTGTDAPILALAVQNGSVYAGGEFLNAGGAARSRLAKFSLTDGSLDAAWTPNANNTVRAIAVDAAGAAYVAGNFNAINGFGRNAVAKLQASGAIDSGWNAQLTGSPTNAVLLDGSSVYLCGKINKVAGINIRALTKVAASNGARDTGWAANVSQQGGAQCWSLAADASNLYFGGQFRRVDNTNRANLAKVAKSNGALQAWNPGANAAVRTLTIDAAGGVYAAGDFSTLAGGARARLGKVDAAGALVAGWSANANRVPQAIALSPTDEPIVGGTFSLLGATGVSGLSRLSATTGAVDPGFVGSAGGPGLINAFVVDRSGGIIVGGVFDAARDQGGALQARANLLRLAPDYSLDLAWTADTVGNVEALAIDSSGAEDAIYVGGTITSIKGSARTRLAKLTGTSPTVDATWVPTADAMVSELVFANGSVYAGGDFQNIGGAARAFAGKLSNTTGAAAAWNPDTDGAVASIHWDAAGVLLGGDFSTLNAAAATRANLALVDDTAGTVVAGFTADTDGPVFALHEAGAQVLVGGSFASLSGQTTSNLGRVEVVSGAPDASFLPMISGTVRSLEMTGGFVYAGGAFALADGVSHPNLARVTDATGIVDHSWQPGTDQEVRQVAMLADATIFAAGPFDNAVGQPVGGVVRFSQDTRHTTEVEDLVVAPSGPNAAIGQTYTIAFAVDNTSTADTPVGTASVQSVGGTPAETNNCAQVSLAVDPNDSSRLLGSFTCVSNRAGPHTVTAAFTGAPRYMDSQTPTSYGISQATTTLTLTTSSPSAFGATVAANLNLAASSAGDPPSGAITVEVRDAGNALVDGCSVNPATLGASSCNLSAATFVQVAGSYSVTASFAGDANYAGDSTDAAATHVVDRISTMTSFDSLTPTPSFINQNYSVTVAVVASDASTPTGSIQVSDGTDSCSIDAVAFASGDRDCELPSNSVGTKSLIANFTGTGNYADSGAAASHDVQQAATSLALSLDKASAVVGETITATVTFAAIPAGAVVPSGSIAVTGCAAPIAISSLVAGVGSCTLSANAVGTLNVDASYAGDTNFTGSNATQQSVTVSQATTTLALALNWSGAPAAPVVGQTLTATVTFGVTPPGGGTPNGNIVVSGCSAPIAIASLVAGQGSCTLAAGNAGVLQSVSASFAGDAVYAASSDSEDVTPTQASTAFSAFSAPIMGGTPGASLAFNWTLGVSAPGAGTPTGSVQVSIDGTGVAPECSAAVGTATCNISFPSTGTFTLRAVYAGDANFLGATSTNSVVITISPDSADLQIQKVVTRSHFDSTIPLEEVEFVIVAGNLGPATVTGATLSDALPPGLINADWTCVPNDAGASCGQPSGTGGVNLSVNLAPNSTVTVTLLADVQNAPFPGITNTATIAVPAGVNETTPADNSSSAFYQRCAANRGPTLTEHFCNFRDGFETP